MVDAMDLGLHLGMPALDQDGEFTDQPERNQSNRISSAGSLRRLVGIGLARP